ncbi:hypothetical protein [Wohlfahrtiimonas chitiniclastica]|uniref:hypothetical protein n=1 Tax=Wohlfahrtiimonas chitiniclastica TaxID=400946 RepID=UPI000B98FD18|nr:hypothetical protein [Wohlfahrtiimonas chitiniclastica]OYQ85406.1 hypothetical protein B9T14_02635 [Wohlfahrtiimonas chitiniclastica]OYQ86360.1 hypothetical protein B9T15_02400 [Wohlfahrtiimonas chitiniclastica]
MEKIDDTKVMSLGAFVVATIVLLVIAVRDPSALGEIYWIYCLAFAGLKVSKGIVSTMQKRDELSNLRKQNYERNDDIERDFNFVVKRPGSQLETETHNAKARRSNS